jgi:hypothetical protein
MVRFGFLVVPGVYNSTFLSSPVSKEGYDKCVDERARDPADYSADNYADTGLLSGALCIDNIYVDIYIPQLSLHL